MLDIDLKTLVYEKPEIDAILRTEKTRVDLELSEKADKIHIGAPDGIARLTPEGRVPITEINVATVAESGDKNNNTTLITPERLLYQIGLEGVAKSSVGVPDGVAPLDGSGLVPSINLPPSRIVQTFVVLTKADMEELPLNTEVKEGDRCVVTAPVDTEDLGEWVANTDAPPPGSWSYIPVSYLVNSVNGQTGSVNIVSIQESAQNKIDIAASGLRFDDVNRQFNFDSSKLGVDIDSIRTTGYYEVDTNLPIGEVLGELRVRYDTESPARIIQEFIAVSSTHVARRQFDGTVWEAWAYTPQTVFNTATVDEFNARYTKLEIDRKIVNTYSGTSLPNSAQGKTGDRYNRYTSDVDNTYKSGASAEDYAPQGFYVFKDLQSNDLYEIFIEESTHKIYCNWGTSKPPLHNPVLTIDDTDINIVIEFSSDTGFDGVYSSEHDALIQAITTSSTFILKAKELSGKDEEYENFDGEWFFSPVMDNTYDFVKKGILDTGSPIIITQDTYQDVAELVLPDRKAGVYEIMFATVFAYNPINNSTYFQVSTDGGQSWNEYRYESKGNTDKIAAQYAFPYVHSGGTIDLKMMARCDTAGNVLTIDSADIVCERKK